VKIALPSQSVVSLVKRMGSYLSAFPFWRCEVLQRPCTLDCQ